jgi:hypothetical protein
MEIRAIGIDLGKTLFHLVGVDASGSVVVRKRCSRKQLLTYTANLKGPGRSLSRNPFPLANSPSQAFWEVPGKLR